MLIVALHGMANLLPKAATETESRAIGTISLDRLNEVNQILTGLAGRAGDDIKSRTIVLKSEQGPPTELILLRNLQDLDPDSKDTRDQ